MIRFSNSAGSKISVPSKGFKTSKSMNLLTNKVADPDISVKNDLNTLLLDIKFLSYSFDFMSYFVKTQFISSEFSQQFS